VIESPEPFMLLSLRTSSSRQFKGLFGAWLCEQKAGGLISRAHIPGRCRMAMYPDEFDREILKLRAERVSRTVLCNAHPLRMLTALPLHSLIIRLLHHGVRCMVLPWRIPCHTSFFFRVCRAPKETPARVSCEGPELFHNSVATHSSKNIRRACFL
jgi:hypothetical protein